jgi:1-acyl-sn-glycerol-3-phosphate acyltransferase
MNRVAENITDRAMRVIARILAAGRVRTVSRGLENLPPHGPVLIVARHYHHLFDGLMLFSAIERRFHIVVTLDWAKNRRGKLIMETLNRFARWPMILRADALARNSNHTNGLFANADTVRYQRRTLRQTIELLRDRRVVVIFPEGYPTIDPNFTPKLGTDDFLPFQPGFVHIAAAAEKRLGIRVPIIPAGVRYESGTPWIGYLTLGTPVYRDQFLTKESLIRSVEHRVRELSEQCSAEVNAIGRPALTAAASNFQAPALK